MSKRIEVLSCPSPNAILLLSHGLNNSAVVLDEMTKLIPANDLCVVKLLLSGHEQDGTAGQRNWDELWVEDMVDAIHRSDVLAKLHQVPLCFVGFSLSTIVFLNAIEKCRARFDRIIFFSPPLLMSRKFRFIEILGHLGLRYVPSLNDPRYRAHRFLPISMYHSLFALVRRLSTINKLSLPSAGVIFMDRKDEMVNYDGVTTWIRSQKIPWPIVPIVVGEKIWPVFRHLICVESNIGVSARNFMKSISKNFIGSGKSIEGTLAVTAYEHFFLNEENEEYPISIVVRLIFNGALDKTRFETALEKAQIFHPMLRARINGLGFQRRNRLRWIILASGFKPYIDWQEIATIESFPEGKREINLMSEIGVRAFVRKWENKTEVTFQIHHACVDGIGTMQFIQSVFRFYREPERQATAPQLEEIKTRKIEYGKTFLAIWRDLRLLRKFSSFRACPIAAPKANLNKVQSAQEKGFLGCIVQREMDFRALQTLANKAHDQQLTLNDVLVKALGETIKGWNRRFNFGTDVRVTLPVNLRTESQRKLSACNITGMYFVDFGSKEKTFQDLHLELMGVKVLGLASAFNRFVAIIGSFPYGIRKINRRPRSPGHSQTSTCISNMGVIDEWWPGGNGEGGEADLPLVQAFGCAPLRPGTRMTFCFATLKGAMTITALADPKFFSKEEAQEFLDLFVKYLTDWVKE